MAEEYKASKGRPLAIGIAAAVGLGTFYLMRKRVRVCIDLPDIWSSKGPLHLTDDAYKRAERYIANRLYKHTRFEKSDEEIIDRAQLLCDTANHLQECKWGEIDSARAAQVYEGLSRMIKTLEAEMKEDPQGFFARYGL